MIKSGQGGRSDPTKSNAVWRFHQKHNPRVYTKCFNCGKRTKLRLRKDNEIKPLCIAHFCIETGTSEETMKKAINGSQREPASDKI